MFKGHVVVICAVLPLFLVLTATIVNAQDLTRSQRGYSDASEIAPLPSRSIERTLAKWALWGGIGLVVFVIGFNIRRRMIK